MFLTPYTSLSLHLNTWTISYLNIIEHYTMRISNPDLAKYISGYWHIDLQLCIYISIDLYFANIFFLHYTINCNAHVNILDWRKYPRKTKTSPFIGGKKWKAWLGEWLIVILTETRYYFLTHLIVAELI